MYNLDTFQVYAQNLAFSIQIGSFVYFSVFLHLISFLKCVKDVFYIVVALLLSYVGEYL